jgi:hypothetical protein
MKDDGVSALNEMSVEPADKGRFAEWIELADVVPVLQANAESEEFIVYASMLHCYVHAVVVPRAAVLDELDVEDLLRWSFGPDSSWGISHSWNPRQVEICPPLDHTGSRTLSKGEQLVFRRDFEGRLGSPTYVEVLQKFAHVFDLHYLPEREAYCRLDDHGEIEDCIRIVRLKDGKGGPGGMVVTFLRELLDRYLALTDSVVVRTFDFTRLRSGSFGGWPIDVDRRRVVGEDIYYEYLVVPQYASFMRGVQIVRPRITKEDIADEFDDPHKTREYASFVAQDFKNNEIREISTAPEETANYFTKSELPFEMSPAFFNPEVLQKYKADSDRYRLSDRSISCRGAWHLETYDINEAGQVFTYLVYLGRLPYREQLHWKAYNEPPKAPISARARKVHFEGNWDLDYDPLDSLKAYLRDLDQAVPWWTLRSDKALEKVQYPVTQSADEWANELLHLDQLIVEGFDEKWLRAKAQKVGRNPDPKSRSLKLIEDCLIGLGLAREEALALTAPLHHLHELRSKVKGHVGGSGALELKRQALAHYKTYPQHFRALCAECDGSIRAIADALGH